MKRTRATSEIALRVCRVRSSTERVSRREEVVDLKRDQERKEEERRRERERERERG